MATGTAEGGSGANLKNHATSPNPDLCKSNEEGTEAAAASAVVGRVTGTYIGPPTPVFRADRPFLFLIRDNQTEAVLFLGRGMQPHD